MEIDAVEPAVRAAFEASVEEDPDRFHEAIEDILDRGDDFTIEAFQLAINVTAIVLQDMHDGEVPGAQEISDLAEDFAETQEDWSEVSADLARTYMASAMGEEAVLDVMSRATSRSPASRWAGGWCRRSCPRTRTGAPTWTRCSRPWKPPSPRSERGLPARAPAVVTVAHEVGHEHRGDQAEDDAGGQHDQARHQREPDPVAGQAEQRQEQEHEQDAQGDAEQAVL